MSVPNENLSRRDLLKASSTVAAAGAISAAMLPGAYAGVDSTIQIALVGCGGRGTGAVQNALSTTAGPTKLVAMADVFQDKMDSSYEGIKGAHEAKVAVTKDSKFIGFDAYKKAMDLLKPGDVVIMATPVAFRPLQFEYAIQKGLNVFMEKPVTVDGPGSRRMLELAAESVKKNLKVGVGLMCRHCEARGELFNRVKAGEIGDLVMIRCYRQAGPTGSAFTPPKPEGMSELLYQIRNFHGFLWASGGGFSDFLIHNVDEGCWMKDDFPVEARASGGRHFRGDYVDQNFDTYSVEYTFKDGSKMFLEGRTMPGCDQQFATFIHGTKGSAVVSQAGHMPSKARIYKSQKFTKEDLVWQAKQPEPNPYQLEWDHLMDAIRNDKPFNEVERGTKSSIVTSMGRMAAHTGQVVTYDDMLNHEHAFSPQLASLTMDSPAPLQIDAATGKYPVPQPGLVTSREF